MNNCQKCLQNEPPPAEGLHMGTFLWCKNRQFFSTCLCKKIASEYVSPSDTDDTSENKEFNYLLHQKSRLTAVSNLDEPPNYENVVYSHLMPFQEVSTFQHLVFSYFCFTKIAINIYSTQYYFNYIANVIGFFKNVIFQSCKFLTLLQKDQNNNIP